jgi:hypothetical protein
VGFARLSPNGCDRVQHEFRPSRFRLLLQQRPQLEAGHALRKARHVEDGLDVHHLAAGAHALDHQDAESMLRRHGGGGEAGDAGADDGEINFPHLQRHSSTETVALWWAPIICQ